MKPFVVAALALPVAFAAQEAHASLKLCNRTSYVLYAATAVSSTIDSTVKGWTRIVPGACRVAIDGDLIGSAYYVYAHTSTAHLGASRTWVGTSNFCTKSADFSLHQPLLATSCASADMSELPFAAIPTHHMRSWTATFRETPDFDSMKSAERAGLKRLLRDNGAADIASEKAADAALAAFGKRMHLSDKAGIGGTFDALETEAMKSVAPAGYSICNETSDNFLAALGQKKDALWESRGWWMVAPGNCARAISEPIANDKIFLRVEKVKGRVLISGPEKFCVTAIEFDIQGRERCAARGLVEAGFMETNSKGAAGFAAQVSEAGLVPGPGTSK
jgi:uncharacterized membrane protein